MFILKISKLTPTITFRCSYLWRQGKKKCRHDAPLPSCLSPGSLIPVLPACVRGQEDPAWSRSRIPTHPLWQDPSPPFHFQSPVVPPVYEPSPVSLLPQYLPHTHTCLRRCSLLRHPSLVLLPNGSRGGCQSLPPTPALSPLQLRVTGFCPTAPLTLLFAFAF